MKKIILFLFIFVIALSVSVFGTWGDFTSLERSFTASVGGNGDFAYDYYENTIWVGDQSALKVEEYLPNGTATGRSVSIDADSPEAIAVNQSHVFAYDYIANQIDVSNKDTDVQEVVCSVPATGIRMLDFPPNSTATNYEFLYLISDTNDNLYIGTKDGTGCYTFQSLVTLPITSNQRGGMSGSDMGDLYYVGQDPVNLINASFEDTGIDPISDAVNRRGVSLNVTSNGSIQGFAYKDGGIIEQYSVEATSGATAPVDTTPPTVTINTIVEKTKDVPFIINVDVNELSNCTLGNETAVYNTTDQVNGNFNINYPSVYDQYQTINFNVSCVDDAGNQGSDTYTVLIDTVVPLITVNTPVNESSIESPITIDISCFDENIFRLNYTLSNASIVTSVENNTNDSVSDNGVLSIVDIETLGAGTYSLDIECADSHTKKKIKDYDKIIDHVNKKIIFTPYESDFIIEVKTKKSEVEDITATKQDDRYNFKFKFKDKAGIDTYTFYLISDEPLKQITDSPYPHFISSKNWVDFNLDDDSVVYEVITHSDKLYEIVISSSLDELNFDSIGDLNINNEYIEFTVIEAPTPSDDVIVGDQLLGNIIIILLLLITGASIIGFMIFDTFNIFKDKKKIKTNQIIIKACIFVTLSIILLAIVSIAVDFMLNGF